MFKYQNKFALAAILLLTVTRLCYATTSVVQLKVESNARCNSLSTNSILQARDSSYSVGTDGLDQASGSDGQIIKYKLTGVGSVSNNRIEWKVTSPNPNNIPATAKRINFIILKLTGSNGSLAAYYVNPGEYQDVGVTAPAQIEGVSFCYGLSQPFSASLPECEGPYASACTDIPSSGVQARIISTFDEPADDTSNWQVKTCACNAQQFTECDPNIPPGNARRVHKNSHSWKTPDADGTLLIHAGRSSTRQKQGFLLLFSPFRHQEMLGEIMANT